MRIRAFILVEIKLFYDQAQILTIRLPSLWLSNFIARSFSKLALFVKLFTLFSRSEIVLLELNYEQKTCRHEKVASLNIPVKKNTLTYGQRTAITKAWQR